MGARKLVAVALLAAFLLAQPLHGQGSVANFPSVLPVGLGFSQGSVAPVSAGIPVYAAGDQLWFRAYSSGAVNVTLYQPLSGGLAAGIPLDNIPGNTSVLLFSFSNTDPTGRWTLDAGNSAADVSLQFSFVSGGAPTSLSGYGVQADGQLDLNYTLDSAPVYDLGACTAGNQSSSSAGFSIPAALGGGALFVSLDGSQLAISSHGTATTLFGLWMTLSQDYSQEIGNTSTIVTRNAEVADTTPVQFATGVNGSFRTSLLDILPLRTGEFTLSANFQGGHGLTTIDTKVLVTGTGSWVWLQGCSSVSNTVSNSVTVTSSLQAPASQWPRYVYLLYEEFGVELFSAAPVTVEPAVVELVASAWGTQLTDDQVTVHGAQNYAVGNGTIYLVGAVYPLQFSVSTPQTSAQVVEVSQPYSLTQVAVAADQVVVKTLSGGSSAQGTVVTLADANGTVAVETSANGQATFYVPPGDFRVQGTYAAETELSSLTTNQTSPAGQSLQVTLQFGVIGTGPLTYFLLAALAVGIVINGAVWVRIYQRKSHMK